MSQSFLWQHHKRRGLNSQPTGSFWTFFAQPDHSARGSTVFAGGVSNDGASPYFIRYSTNRPRTISGSKFVRTSYCYAPSTCTEIGTASARTNRSRCQQASFHTNGPGPSRSSGRTSRMQVIFHPMAASAVSKTAAATSDSSNNSSNTSIYASNSTQAGSTSTSTRDSNRTAKKQQFRDPFQPRRSHCHVFSRTRFTTFGSHPEASQAHRGQCQRSNCDCGDSRVPSSASQLLGIDDWRPSSSMGVKADDIEHGFCALQPDVLPTHSRDSHVGSPPMRGPITLRLDSLLAPSNLQEKQFWNLRETIDQALAPWPLDFLISDLATAAHVLPDLPTELRCFFTQFRLWEGELVSKVHLFTDGSSSQSGAAWALVVVYECWLDSDVATEFVFRGFCGSHLRPFAEWIRHGFNVGESAEDALSAELTGIIWALGWALQDSVCDEFHFHYDSLSAGHGAFGQWNPPKGSDFEQLVRSATSLRQLLSVKAKCSGHHIAAHTGAPWNELADAFAKAFTKRILSPMSLPAGLPALLHRAMLDHAWTELASSYSSSIRPCTAWRSIFRREGPRNPLSADRRWIASSHVVAESAQTSRETKVTLKLATANVLTLAIGTQANQRNGKLD